MDYTPGGFRNVAPDKFRARGDLPMVADDALRTGWAMYVVYDSPLAAVADSPDTYAESPAGLEFIREVPASWDETRFLAGEVGEFVVVARRKGKTWYLGAMNAETARRVRVPLDFLGGKRAEVTLWADGAAPDAVAKTSRTLTGPDVLELELAATGGAVAVLRPR